MWGGDLWDFLGLKNASGSSLESKSLMGKACFNLAAGGACVGRCGKRAILGPLGSSSSFFMRSSKRGSVVVRAGITTGGVYSATELGIPEKCLRYAGLVCQVFCKPHVLAKSSPSASLVGHRFRCGVKAQKINL